MKDKRTKKGSDLENAVGLIQEMIFNADPKLKKRSFTIELNRVIKVGGAKQEIDVFVQTEPGTDYEATYIFECKDWEKPVGTQPVQVLSDKVELISATRGFLVARNLTKDANAMLKNRPRLGFIRCAREFSGPVSLLFTALHLARDPVAENVSLKFRGTVLNENSRKVDWASKKCVSHGQTVNLVNFLECWFYDLAMQDSNLKGTEYAQEGSHPSSVCGRKDFQSGEFLLDGFDVEYIELTAFYIVRTRKLKFRSQFELEGRGRTISFESEGAAGKNLQVDVIMPL